MNKLDKIVIATRNPGKIKRYKELLSKLADIVLNLDDLNIKDRVNEMGKIAEENAEIKARFYAQKTNLPVFSEDEALYVDFLPINKQPGVHVRRIEGGKEVDDNQLLSYWEELVNKSSKEKRTGKWHFAFCLATPGGKIKMVALDHPIIFFSPSSKIKIPGWPMSSLQGPVKFKKPHSEMTDKEQRQLNQEADNFILRALKGFL